MNKIYFLMYKMIASVYRYNKKKKWDSPHFATLINLSACTDCSDDKWDSPHFATLINLSVIFMFIFGILIVLLGARDSLRDILSTYWRTDSRVGDYLIAAIISTPLLALLWFLFPERKMKEQEALLTKREYRWGLFFYVLLLILAFIVLAKV